MKAVVFDLYGTLVPKWSRAHGRANLRVMSDALGLPADALIRAWDETFLDRELGRHGTYVESIGHICRRLSHDATPEQIEAAAAWRLKLNHERLRPRSDAVPTLTRLREQGMKVGLLSNCGVGTPEACRAGPLVELCDATVFSSEVGLMKPDRAIYDMVAEALGVDPAESLFVGDGGSRELSGARDAGMRPVLIHVQAEVDEEGVPEDADGWSGARVTSLTEILGLLPGG